MGIKRTPEEREAKRAEREAKRAEREAKRGAKKAEEKRKAFLKQQARMEYLAERIHVVVKTISRGVVARFEGVKEIQLEAAEKAAKWLSKSNKQGYAILSGTFENTLTGASGTIFREFSDGVEVAL